MTVPATAPNLAPWGSGGVPPGSDTAPVTGRGTLRRRLVLQVVALVALVAIVLSALTTVVVHELLVNQLDQQLAGVAGRGRSDPDRGGPPDRLNRPGQPIGTLVAVILDTGERGGAVLREGGKTEQLPDPVLDQVATLSLIHI